MGVGFRVGDDSTGAQWSYSGFNEFRHRIAKEIGIDLDQMEGFGKEYEHMPMPSLVDVMAGRAVMPTQQEIERHVEEAGKRYAESGGHIPWDTIDDPLKHLLHHSDCDGNLAPELCALVAPRIRTLVAKWPDIVKLEINPEFRKVYPAYPEVMELNDHDKTNALLLAAGMELAAQKGVPLDFC